jgi:GT2 family glycosyltransferase
MISIIVVYNNERILNEILSKGLKNQTAKFELITLDNTRGQFKSAAEALNYGGNKAKGKYIMFVHQDVELDSDSWLENVEKLLDDIHDLGIAGVAGMSEKGRNFAERRRGYISDCGEIWGEALEKAEVVQTLDECLLVVPKSVFEKIQFDEKTFDNWHCYGADYCLVIKQMELKTYVIPAFVYHRSLRSNIKGLVTYQKRLYNKHRENYRRIYTTLGEIYWLRLKYMECIRFFRPFYKKFFKSLSWIDYLKKELSDCNTILDLGCGYNSSIQYCNVPFSVGVELFEPYLQESKKKGIHDEYIKADITKIEFKPKSFDAILCSEVFEHLTKEDGHELIKKMEKWAKKKIIITTPNEYLWQDGYDNNPLQEHKSGWGVEELEKLGFKVYGINGWKKLRGYKGSVKYKPIRLWIVISDLTQKITYQYPKLAFQLFAIKKINN